MTQEQVQTSELVQGSDEWLLARAGHATASRFADVMAKIKTGEAASRRNYRTQLVTERLTGLPVDTYRNTAMQWGNDHEEEARGVLEERLGILTEKTGFLKHPIVSWCGCSPDAMIGRFGLAQIKCPFVSTNHIETIQRGTIPPEYIAQVQGELWVTGREWSIYVSYDPRMPENLQLFAQKIARDEVYINNLASEVKAFLLEIENGVRILNDWTQPKLKKPEKILQPNTAGQVSGK